MPRLIFILGSLILLLTAYGARADSPNNVWKPGDEPILLLSPAQIFKDTRLRQLAQAARQGDIKTVDRLIVNGVDVNGHGKYGISPLFSAWQSGNKAGFKTLLTHGANPNNVWTTGNTLLNLIAGTADPYFLKLALAHGANPNLVAPYTCQTPIFSAVDPLGPEDSPLSDGRENVSLLMQAGANINYQACDDGETSLMAASDLSQYGVVLQLLKAGANYKLKDKWGHDLRMYVDMSNKAMDKSGLGGKQLQKVIDFLKAHNFWPPPKSQQIQNTAATPATVPRIINYQAPGNLAATHAISCIAAGKLNNKDTPADLYPAVMQCLNEEKYERAVFIYALAGVYTRFDTLRVADETAHDAATVFLSRIVDAVPREKLKQFDEAKDQTFNDDKQLAAICARIRKIGPPDYYPRYMVQHGMQAFTGFKTPNGLVPGFDAKKAWEESLTSYLHCPDAKRDNR